MKRKTLGLIIAMLFITSSLSFAIAQDESFKKDDALATEQNISTQKGFSMFQIDALIDKGYTYDEISEMSIETVNNILTKDLDMDEIAKYNAANEKNLGITATAPNEYTCVASVPDGGGTNEWFHPNANTTENTISNIVNSAKAGAQNIFDSSYTYPNLRYSYYLFGEWGEDPGYENWCHEGVDMKHAVTSTASVYSPISGVVSKSSSSGKYVNIYNSSLGITMNFQHLNDVQGTTTLAEGEPVEAGQYLGKQNTTDQHVHVQVCSHSNCTSVHSGRDLTLNCISPYSYID